MTKLVTDKCPCCGTRGLNPKKIKDMCENCLETSFDQWRRKVASLEKDNTELQKKYDELNDFSNSELAKCLMKIQELKKFVKSCLDEESIYTKADIEKLLEL